MIAVPFAPIERETLRGFFDKLRRPVRGAFLPPERVRRRAVFHLSTAPSAAEDTSRA